ncbi:hypothetical protein ABID82_000805 [Methylobacterium sp. PvP062]|uniref:Uncharacterized protein n=1 Tax=Methylobacterium radiotolerans TaxID=31998 RepID=A0ABV2NHW1_9HYPH|nr:hypothetical protein [Methylobacterium sp. PvP105]MBP2502840.1 hypothetical protein [Methylobacterium sp. PvP109]
MRPTPTDAHRRRSTLGCVRREASADLYQLGQEARCRGGASEVSTDRQPAVETGRPRKDSRQHDSTAARRSACRSRVTSRSPFLWHQRTPAGRPRGLGLNHRRSDHVAPEDARRCSRSRWRSRPRIRSQRCTSCADRCWNHRGRRPRHQRCYGLRSRLRSWPPRSMPPDRPRLPARSALLRAPDPGRAAAYLPLRYTKITAAPGHPARRASATLGDLIELRRQVGAARHVEGLGSGWRQCVGPAVSPRPYGLRGGATLALTLHDEAPQRVGGSRDGRRR